MLMTLTLKSQYTDMQVTIAFFKLFFSHYTVVDAKLKAMGSLKSYNCEIYWVQKITFCPEAQGKKRVSKWKDLSCSVHTNS